MSTRQRVSSHPSAAAASVSAAVSRKRVEKDVVAPAAVKKTKARKLAKRLRAEQALLTQVGEELTKTDRTIFLSKNDAMPTFNNTVTCPVCMISIKMTKVDEAARLDRYDHSFECPDCHEQFAPVAHITIATPGVEDDYYEPFIWLCRMQTRDQFAEWLESKNGTLDELRDETLIRTLSDERPEIYWNALRYAAEDGGFDPKDIPAEHASMLALILSFLR